LDPLGTLTLNFRPAAFSARVHLAKFHHAERLRWSEAEIQTAGAYTGWRRGVIHVRDEYWLIYDILPQSVRAGGASIALQFPPEASLTKRSRSAFAVSVGSAAIDIALSQELQNARVVAGEAAPLGGWISRGYGQLQAAPQLRLESNAGGRVQAFVLKRSGGPSILSVETASLDAGLGLRVVSTDHTDTFLLSTGPSAARLGAWDVEFRGRLAWLRNAQAGADEFAWVDGEALAWSTGSLEASSVVHMLEGRTRAGGMQLSSVPEEAIAWISRR
jgi:hypothetical protein